MATRKPRVQIQAHLTTPAPRIVALPSAVELPIAYIVPDPKQPRQDWEHGEGARRLEELARSIGEFGVLQPLLVRTAESLADGTPRYMIIAGGRRWAAAERAGLATIPVVIRDQDQDRVRVFQLIENLQRQDLSPIDEAHAYKELMDLEVLSPPGVAERLHISAQQVRDRLRLLADQVLADAVERRQISATAAREIAKLPDAEIAEFRTRVENGERLQTNDVAVARARLLQQGAVHPRRKGPPRAEKQTSFVSTPVIDLPLPEQGASADARVAAPAIEVEQHVAAETARGDETGLSAERVNRARVLATMVDVLAAGFQGPQRAEALTVFRDLLGSPDTMTLWRAVLTETVSRWER